MTRVAPIDLDTLLATADARRPRSRQTTELRAVGKWGVGPSDYGTCRKSIEYRENPPDDYEPMPADDRAAYLGSIIHDGIRRLLRRKRSVLTEFDIPLPGFDAPGHGDLFELRFARYTDWKTAGEWRWERVLESGPPADDVVKGMVYATGIREMGHPCDTVRLVYVRRATGETATFERDYDPDLATYGIMWLHSVIESLDAGVELPRDRKGPSLDGICRRCPARGHCWNLTEAEANGRTPEGWMLARDDDSIAVELIRYREAHVVELSGKAVKDEVKVLVAGAEPGRYDRNTLRWTGGNTKWVDDEEARLEQLTDEMRSARAEGRAPKSPDDLPYPQKPVTSSERIEIKPVRADVLEAEAKAAEEAVAAEAS